MSHLLVVSLMLGQNLSAKFLLALVDIRIKLVPVLSDRELLIIVNWNIYFLSANRFFVWVVELGYIWVLKSLFGRKSLVRVEVQ